MCSCEIVRHRYKRHDLQLYLMSSIENERRFLVAHGLPIYAMNEIVDMASKILEPQDDLLKPGFLYGNLLDVLVPLSLQYNCERALNVPMLTKDMLARYYERETRPKWEHLDYIFGDFPALAVCFPKYWERGGVPQELKKNLARLVLMYQKVVNRID